jgi:hypothetical protein
VLRDFGGAVWGTTIYFGSFRNGTDRSHAKGMIREYEDRKEASVIQMKQMDTSAALNLQSNEVYNV